MKKEYIFAPNFILVAQENGNYSGFDLAVCVALVIGGKLERITEKNDALLSMPNGQRLFVTEAKTTAEIAARQEEYQASWFDPFSSKPIGQELMRRFPMAITGNLFRYGALCAEWVCESNTMFGAGDARLVGLLHGRDSWCITASENVLEAIALNALMQSGCNREAVFYFPAGEQSGQLIFVTPESARLIKSDQQLAAVCVFAPTLDRFAVLGVPEDELKFELENAKLTWQIQIARWSRETGQPVPDFATSEDKQEANDEQTEQVSDE